MRINELKSTLTSRKKVKGEAEVQALVWAKHLEEE